MIDDRGDVGGATAWDSLSPSLTSPPHNRGSSVCAPPNLDTITHTSSTTTEQGGSGDKAFPSGVSRTPTNTTNSTGESNHPRCSGEVAHSHAPDGSPRKTPACEKTGPLPLPITRARSPVKKTRATTIPSRFDSYTIPCYRRPSPILLPASKYPRTKPQPKLQGRERAKKGARVRTRPTSWS